MKEFIFMSVVLLLSTNAFATKAVCQGKFRGIETLPVTIDSDVVETNIYAGIITTQDTTTYLLTFSDLNSQENSSQVLSKDAMVLSFFTNANDTVSTVSDGKTVMLVDKAKDAVVMCVKVN